MSLLNDLWTFWKANAVLQLNFPINPPTGQTKYWVGYVGDGTTMPFVSVNQVTSVPTWTTCGDHFDESIVRFNVYAPTLQQAESLADLVQGELDFTSVGNNEQPARRRNRFALSDIGGAYHIVLEYLFMTNGILT